MKGVVVSHEHSSLMEAKSLVGVLTSFEGEQADESTCRIHSFGSCLRDRTSNSKALRILLLVPIIL